MNNEPMQEEMTIDLLDFLGKFLSKWKQIVACMLVCAVVVLAGGYLRDSANAKAAAQAAAAPTESLENFTFTSITPEQGENTIRMIACYQGLIDNTNAYLENSVLMNLPADTATVYQMQYRIDGTLTNDQKQILVDAYSAALKNDDVYQQASKALAPQYEVKPEYIGELISTTNSMTGSEAAQGTAAGAPAYVDTAEGSTDGTSMLYQVWITGYDEASCKKIADVIDATIQQAMPEIAQLANHIIRLNLAQTSTSVNNSFAVNKKSNYAIVKTTTDEINALESALTDDEKKYVNAAVQGEEKSDVQQEEPAAAELVPAAKPSAKNAAIGALLGFVLVAGWFAVAYLMSSKVHTVSETEERFGQLVLGTIEAPKTEKKMKNALDKTPLAGNRPLPKGTSMELIRQMIGSRAQAAKAEHIGVCCLATGEEAHALCTELAASLSRDGLNAVALGSIVSGPEALHAADDMDAMVFVEALENTDANELKENLKYCSTKNQPVLGAVVLQ